MRYKKLFYITLLTCIIIFNINISSEIIFDINDIKLSQIAYADDTEGGVPGDTGFKKCGQGKISFTPAHGATACLYCGDCLAHWVFLTQSGECKLYSK